LLFRNSIQISVVSLSLCICIILTLYRAEHRLASHLYFQNSPVFAGPLFRCKDRHSLEFSSFFSRFATMGVDRTREFFGFADVAAGGTAGDGRALRAARAGVAASSSSKSLLSSSSPLTAVAASAAAGGFGARDAYGSAASSNATYSSHAIVGGAPSAASSSASYFTLAAGEVSRDLQRTAKRVAELTQREFLVCMMVLEGRSRKPSGGLWLGWGWVPCIRMRGFKATLAPTFGFCCFPPSPVVLLTSTSTSKPPSFLSAHALLPS
jgi:hypothetical protein